MKTKAYFNKSHAHPDMKKSAKAGQRPKHRDHLDAAMDCAYCSTPVYGGGDVCETCTYNEVWNERAAKQIG